MAIRVEFYGVARQRAGVSCLELERGPAPTTLGDVLEQAAAALPQLAPACIERGRLHATLTANLDGERFVTDPQTFVRDGQCVLILSADAGG